MNSIPRIPSVSELLWPTLRAVREIGDSGTIEEIVEKAIELERFTEEQQAVLHGDGPRTKIEYRLAWARSYLKGMGALDNSERGVWSTTEVGRSMTPEDVVSRHAAYVAALREARKAKQLARAEQDDELEEESVRRDWKERLLEVLFEVPPDGFERLARRLLREAGFVSATVTGKSGDGGICIARKEECEAPRLGVVVLLRRAASATGPHPRHCDSFAVSVLEAPRSTPLPRPASEVV